MGSAWAVRSIFFFCQSIHLLCSQQISLEKLHNRDSARYWGWNSKWHQQETLPWLIFTLYWLYVSRLRRLSHPLVSSALIPGHFRRLTWHNQNTVTIIAIQFFFPYLKGAWRKAVGGKSRACLQVNLLVSRHHAVCNGMIDNRTCPSSTGNLLTSVEKGLDMWPPKQSLLGRRCVGYNFLGGEITTLAETKKGRVKNVLRESGMLKWEVGVVWFDVLEGKHKWARLSVQW